MSTDKSQLGLQQILDQIDRALAVRDASRQTNEDVVAYARADAQEIITILAATIDRLAPIGSRYRLDQQRTMELNKAYPIQVLDDLTGVLRALRSDYESGYMRAIQELIHADVFADFLEMATYFLDQGYKDPAAVMVGGVLEEHLRKLCLKNGLPIEDVKPSGNEPKMAGRLNDDLAGQKVYSKLDQKTVTAWLDLRNKAAHGKYVEYTKEQVELMVQGVRDFLTRHPA